MKIAIQVICLVACVIFGLGGIAEKEHRHIFVPASVTCILLAILTEVVWTKLIT
jgi:hypothetical protein